MDVSPEGTVLVEEATHPCRATARGSTAISAHEPSGERREIDRFPDSDALLRLRYDATWRYVNNRLLVWTDREATLRDLRDGSVRRLKPAARKTVFYEMELGPNGDVAATEAKLARRRSFAMRLRLIRPGDPAEGGRVLRPFARRVIDGRFCGDRLVQWRVGRDGRPVLTVTEPGQTPISHRGRRTIPTGTIDTVSCDPRHHAVFFDRAKGRGWVVRLSRLG